MSEFKRAWMRMGPVARMDAIGWWLPARKLQLAILCRHVERTGFALIDFPVFWLPSCRSCRGNIGRVLKEQRKMETERALGK